MRPALPDASFSAIAEDLDNYARNEALALEGVEVFLARYPRPELERVVPGARRAALSAGRLAGLFAALIPHEETVRDFIAGLFELESAERPPADVAPVVGEVTRLPGAGRHLATVAA
jgi:hypothetical protein